MSSKDKKVDEEVARRRAARRLRKSKSKSTMPAHALKKGWREQLAGASTDDMLGSRSSASSSEEKRLKSARGIQEISAARRKNLRRKKSGSAIHGVSSHQKKKDSHKKGDQEDEESATVRFSRSKESKDSKESKETKEKNHHESSSRKDKSKKKSRHHEKEENHQGEEKKEKHEDVKKEDKEQETKKEDKDLNTLSLPQTSESKASGKKQASPKKQRDGKSGTENATASLVEKKQVAQTFTKVYPKAADKLNGKDLQLQETIFELIMTERQFVFDLETVIQYFLKPTEEKSLLDRQSVVQVFSNIQQLYLVNEDLLKAMEAKRKEAGDSAVIRHISDVFVERVALFKHYAVYCSSFPWVNKHIRRLSAQFPQWAALVRKQQRLDRCRQLRLEDLLVQPMQRVCKYSLFLENLVKYTDEKKEKEEHEKLVDTCERVRTIVNQINERTRVVEGVVRLTDIRDSIKDIPDTLDLVNMERRFVSDCKARVCFRPNSHRHARFRSAHVWLFSDIVLAARLYTEEERAELAAELAASSGEGEHHHQATPMDDSVPKYRYKMHHLLRGMDIGAIEAISKETGKARHVLSVCGGGNELIRVEFPNAKRLESWRVTMDQEILKCARAGADAFGQSNRSTADSGSSGGGGGGGGGGGIGAVSGALGRLKKKPNLTLKGVFSIGGGSDKSSSGRNRSNTHRGVVSRPNVSHKKEEPPQGELPSLPQSAGANDDGKRASLSIGDPVTQSKSVNSSTPKSQASASMIASTAATLVLKEKIEEQNREIRELRTQLARAKNESSGLTGSHLKVEQQVFASRSVDTALDTTLQKESSMPVGQPVSSRAKFASGSPLTRSQSNLQRSNVSIGSKRRPNGLVPGKPLPQRPSSALEGEATTPSSTTTTTSGQAPTKALPKIPVGTPPKKSLPIVPGHNAAVASTGGSPRHDMDAALTRGASDAALLASVQLQLVALRRELEQERAARIQAEDELTRIRELYGVTDETTPNENESQKEPDTLSSASASDTDQGVETTGSVASLADEKEEDDDAEHGKSEQNEGQATKVEEDGKEDLEQQEKEEEKTKDSSSSKTKEEETKALKEDVKNEDLVAKVPSQPTLDDEDQVEEKKVNSDGTDDDRSSLTNEESQDESEKGEEEETNVSDSVLVDKEVVENQGGKLLEKVPEELLSSSDDGQESSSSFDMDSDADLATDEESESE